MYYVPNLGPAIYMTKAAEEWAERVKQDVEKAVFQELAMAQEFANRISSRVEDDAGEVVYDARIASRGEPS